MKSDEIKEILTKLLDQNNDGSLTLADFYLVLQKIVVALVAQPINKGK